MQSNPWPSRGVYTTPRAAQASPAHIATLVRATLRLREGGRILAPHHQPSHLQLHQLFRVDDLARVDLSDVADAFLQRAVL